MIGRRVAGLVAVSAATMVFGTVMWGKLVSAQDTPQFQNSQFQNPQFQNPPAQSSGQSPVQSASSTDAPAAPGFDAPPQNGAQPPAQNGAPPSPAGPEPTDPATEVLTRGAVHEAFATPVSYNPVPTSIVPKQPPDPVEEMPPEQKPAGDHVQWIPGYWTWEADDSRYIWTSGIWRAIPTGMEWVPGSWNQANGGYQWVSGYWHKANVTQTAYLPQKPPDSLEAGPVGTAPSPDYVWIPGCWIWRGTNYAWRGGYWAAANPDWIWIPSNYVWTPSGYVFVEGHWDYSMERRGLIFAPVVFRPGVYVGPGYVYSPTIGVDFGVCTGCLFCRPGFGCYCYGDYYAGNYAAIGIYPWFAFHGRYGYDPCFAYYSWRYRGDPHWHERLVVDYRFRMAHIEARPARTFVAMRIGGGPMFAVHINVLAARGGAHFERLSGARRAEIHRAVREQRAAQARHVAMERANAGRNAAAARGRAQTNARPQQQRNTRPASRPTSRSSSRGRGEER